ncbi:uncharacterized protein C8Q71DRAFT_788217 [Rhodofomes roseus]|uniref:Uncharacterized protein n=1 Tax=Rhodofomes roseus TaxID=34475 RepID=A0ABQ8K084_9APHY|nr:uncharacterized protein C8Q71DRAFT_788217 [Rhodofomes roseus]KAH9830001.1 hypothetical protein C8Q71DRAFT_788217 [Rhodofomes roseus]
MCYYLITYLRHGCGHDRPTRRHYIDCNLIICRLSARHKLADHDCDNTCTETMLPDQHIVMESTIDHCDPCLGIYPPTDPRINLPPLPEMDAEDETQ